MSMPGRSIAALGAVTVAIGSLAACGGSASGEIVARVAGGGSISKASLEHWMAVEAVVLYQENPTQPVPKGLIPDQPDYNACIAYLRSTPQKGVAQTGPKPTDAQLKLRCVRRRGELKELALNTLLVWDWTIKAGMELGLSANATEARRRLTEVNARTYPKGAEFTRYLKLTGQTVSDMLLRSRVQIFEVKLTEKLAAAEKALPSGLTAQQRQSAVAKFLEYVPPGKRWAAQTSCLTGYVVSACKEYRGSEAPGVPN